MKILIIVGIVLLGALLRFYRLPELIEYGHDQDLASWIVKDIVIDRHPRLIGQETSTPGILIGPAYYYYLIPFYVVFGMEPAAANIAVGMLGIVWVLSCYFVGSRMFGSRVGMIAALLYAVSFYTVANDREPVPTQPVIAWALWFLYSAFLVRKGKLAGYAVAGILLGLIWHINIALVLLSPILVGALVLGRQHLTFGRIAALVGGCVAVSLPLLAFELRHGFSQTRALVLSLSSNQNDIVSGVEKVERVLLLASKDLTNFIVGSTTITYGFFAAGLLFMVVILAKTNKLKGIVSVFGVWTLMVIGFFSVYTKILSEYYLNSLIVVFLFVSALFIERVWKANSKVALGILVAFSLWNIARLQTVQSNNNTYLNRLAVIDAIKVDAAKHNFPCISVSYITSPGYDLGYRFLFYKSGLRVNRPSSLAPVYSIVFPLRRVDRVDQSFGGIGLIYPDYDRYVKTINEGCADGRNDNLTDPLWGYPN